MLAIFLDQETSGLDPLKHHLLEIAFRIFDVSEGKEIAAYETIVQQSRSVWERSSPESLQVNGFTWEEIASGKPLSLVRSEVIELFGRSGVIRGKAVFICQNPAFDRGFFSQVIDVETHEKLNWPYHWLDLASMYWLVKMRSVGSEGAACPTERELSKDRIASEYKLPPEKRPHRAMNGVNHLIECYRAVVGNFSGFVSDRVGTKPSP